MPLPAPIVLAAGFPSAIFEPTCGQVGVDCPAADLPNRLARGPARRSSPSIIAPVTAGQFSQRGTRYHDIFARVAGYDAGKKIKGRKRYIVVDTLGLMAGLVVHSADIQDRVAQPQFSKPSS